jgi:outer membrane protein assembly factor BamC
MKTFVASTIALALLAGCSMDRILPEGKKIDYKSAAKQSLPPLQVPPDLTAPGRDNRYSVPDVAATPREATFSAYQAERAGAPRGSASTAGEVLPSVDKIRMERNGDQRWLVLPDAPDKVWPLVKEFWQESGFLVNLEQPAVGVMETDWAEDRAKIPLDGIRKVLGKVLDGVYDSGMRDKFRTRLERSASGGTEIYISHRGMEEKYISGDRVQTVWQPRAPDPSLEAEFLRRMMVRFGVDDATAQTQLTAAAARPVERAKLTRIADGTATLDLDEPFDRAWRRVGLALDRVGFTVEDRDRSKGYYFVRYVDPESDTKTKKDDSGILSKLAFWRSNDPKKNSNEQFRVMVKDTADVSQVQVQDKNGVTDKSDTSRKILTLLHEQLR